MNATATKTRELMERLVAFDTTSRESNLDLIHFVRDYLSGLGVESTLIQDRSEPKANLFATIGPQDRPGIMLSGHTDVVPVDGQDWSSDPFRMIEKGGRLFGRGTCDMKGFIAIALAHIPELLGRGLATPIHLALSYDEEIGCLGVRHLIDLINTLPVKPRMAIIGEPTEMQVIVAHKGKTDVTVRVRGYECHSALAPDGVNAVQYAAELISHISGMARRVAADGPFDDEFDVAHGTLHTGLVQGGTALNIVPKDCRFEFEIRNLPQQDPQPLLDEIYRFAAEELEPRMQAVHPDTGFDFDQGVQYPGLDMRPDDEAVTLVKALAGQNSHAKVAFGTEGGLFQQDAQIPCVICGPGSIAQAHKPDEYLALDQLAAGQAFMGRLADRVCSG
ncbi:MAG: acetylornithine deacetylase [Alphaproteobacteria bacterium]|nr:acetylornithine deacetylase [Alphaproteobacteria bacterium]